MTHWLLPKQPQKIIASYESACYTLPTLLSESFLVGRALKAGNRGMDDVWLQSAEHSGYTRRAWPWRQVVDAQQVNGCWTLEDAG